MTGKLFSTKSNQLLVGYTIIYKHNLSRSGAGSDYSLQAAEAAVNIIKIFIEVAKSAKSYSDLKEIEQKIKDCLRKEPTFRKASFDEQKDELELWLKKEFVTNKNKAKKLRGLYK